MMSSKRCLGLAGLSVGTLLFLSRPAAAGSISITGDLGGSSGSGSSGGSGGADFGSSTMSASGGTGIGGSMFDSMDSGGGWSSGSGGGIDLGGWGGGSGGSGGTFSSTLGPDVGSQSGGSVFDIGGGGNAWGGGNSWGNASWGGSDWSNAGQGLGVASGWDASMPTFPGAGSFDLGLGGGPAMGPDLSLGAASGSPFGPGMDPFGTSAVSGGYGDLLSSLSPSISDLTGSSLLDPYSATPSPQDLTWSSALTPMTGTDPMADLLAGPTLSPAQQEFRDYMQWLETQPARPDDVPFESWNREMGKVWDQRGADPSWSWYNTAPRTLDDVKAEMAEGAPDHGFGTRASIWLGDNLVGFFGPKPSEHFPTVVAMTDAEQELIRMRRWEQANPGFYADLTPEQRAVRDAKEKNYWDLRRAHQDLIIEGEQDWILLSMGGTASAAKKGVYSVGGMIENGFAEGAVATAGYLGVDKARKTAVTAVGNKVKQWAPVAAEWGARVARQTPAVAREVGKWGSKMLRRDVTHDTVETITGTTFDVYDGLMGEDESGITQ